ncbi:MAG TPA: hypothetical protein VG966_06650, partial [Hyphomicrobiaceae bacterium]|nr:hypothetical protein [Hyphomicrobiaceae bacterium]
DLPICPLETLIQRISMTIIRLADDDRDMITISIYDLQAAISASPVHDDILKIWIALADY